MKCTDPDIGSLLEDYFLNRLDRPAARAFEDHLFECVRCRREMMAETMLKTLAGKHRNALAPAAAPDGFLDRITAFLDSLAALYPQPAFPVRFRHASARVGTIRDLNLHTVNLSGMLTLYDRKLKPVTCGDKLLIYGFIREMADRDVYLLLNRKADLLELDRDNTGQIRKIIETIGYSFVIGRRLEPEIRDVLERSFVMKGVIRIGRSDREETEAAVGTPSPEPDGHPAAGADRPVLPEEIPGGADVVDDDRISPDGTRHLPRAELALSPVGLSYLQNPEYIAILIVM